MITSFALIFYNRVLSKYKPLEYFPSSIVVAICFLTFHEYFVVWIIHCQKDSAIFTPFCQQENDNSARVLASNFGMYIFSNLAIFHKK